jgi:hypothetical protein
MENKESRSTSIFMYSSTLYPVMKYDYAQQQMLNSNTVILLDSLIPNIGTGLLLRGSANLLLVVIPGRYPA